MSNVTRHNSPWPEPSPPERDQHMGYPQGNPTTFVASSLRPSQFLGTYGDMSLLEDGFYREKYGDISDNYHKIHAKAGGVMDPRLLMLLEFFRELYLRRREMFGKIFPVPPDDFVHTFKKIRAILLSGKSGQANNTTRAFRRSLSVGSTRIRSVGGDHESMRPDRFKVKTVNPRGGGDGVGVGGGGAQGGQSDDIKTAGGSKFK